MFEIQIQAEQAYGESLWLKVSEEEDGTTIFFHLPSSYWTCRLLASAFSSSKLYIRFFTASIETSLAACFRALEARVIQVQKESRGRSKLQTSFVGLWGLDPALTEGKSP